MNAMSQLALLRHSGVNCPDVKNIFYYENRLFFQSLKSIWHFLDKKFLHLTIKT